MMSSRQFDEEYKEYMERRDRERHSDVTTVPEKSRRFRPSSRRQTPAMSDEKRAQLKGDGSYSIPNNIYHSSGYVSRRSELGEDPISTVRTLRSQMRRMAIKYREDDTLVRAHLCERACDRLTAVEGELTALGRQRTDAILNGDTRKAEKLAMKMDELKEDSVRDTYSDLVMDKNEMRAFGVNSEWTPVKRAEDPKLTLLAPPPPAKKQSKPLPITIQTQTEDSVEQEKIEEKKVEEKKMSPPREVKRNARLAELLAAQPIAIPITGQSTEQQHDDPYQLPNYMGTCQFCGEISPDFGMESRLENHYTTSCLLMSKCRFCSKVVVVPQLNDHVINRCAFVAGRMMACNACGMAVDATDDSTGVGHPMCRGRPPPDGAEWCPLCAVAVSNTKEAWKIHLTKDCYNNIRRSGPEMEITSPEVKSERNARPSSSVSTSGGSMRNSGARVIDANKLVAALQDVQLRKKQESLKKKASAATIEEKKENQ